MAAQAPLLSLPKIQPAHCPDACPYLRGGICRLACGNEYDRCPVAEGTNRPRQKDAK